MLKVMVLVLMLIALMVIYILEDPGKLWDILSVLDRVSQLGTLLGDLEAWDICPALPSSHRGRVGLLMGGAMVSCT